MSSIAREIIDDILSARAEHGGRPLVLGICGSQGSGKSTLAAGLKQVLRQEHDLAVATLSLDDLYLPAHERMRLARAVHPLLRTRGVPGTHEVGLGIDVIRRLLAAGRGDVTRLPRFDKSRDDRCSPALWEAFRGCADIVIFEGWCVGAVPQSAAALVKPINELERNEDPDGTWRRYVNEQLAGLYQELFAQVDQLLMLRAPSFEVVFEWRRQQERELEAARIMSDAELERFVMHYERLTRHILAEMPARADLVIELDLERRIVRIDLNKPGPRQLD